VSRFGFGTCVNNTDETIAVYGPGEAGIDSALLCTASWKPHTQGLDCDGIYVPDDRSVLLGGLTVVPGPLAVKYGEGTPITITKLDTKYVLPAKPEHVALFGTSQSKCPTVYPLGIHMLVPTAICWPIPAMERW